MSKQRRDHWEAIHRSKREDELSWFQAIPLVSLDLIKASSKPTASVIDIGGGTSHLVDCLLAAGYTDITVLDISDSALALSRRRLNAASNMVDWIVADITTWTPIRQYDVWHDRAVFHFLTDVEDRMAYRSVVQKAVKRGGSVIIGTFTLEGPEMCSGLPIVRYSPKMLSDELGSNFKLVESRLDSHVTPAGSVQEFQFSLFRYRG